MLMMRALRLPQPAQKLAKHRLAPQGRLQAPRVLMMLAGWPPGVVHGGWGEKRGSDKAGSAAVPVALFANAKLASYGSAKPRAHRAHALGDRVLPD